MHPLLGDLSELKNSEIDAKINDLTKKYFITYNTEVRSQIVMVLEAYKEEQQKRQRAEMEKLMQDSNKGLDKLIKVQ